jgi:hypothetical protein
MIKRMQIYRTFLPFYFAIIVCVFTGCSKGEDIIELISGHATLHTYIANNTTTEWHTSLDADGKAEITVTVSTAAGNLLLDRSPMILKGIAYSPAPVGCNVNKDWHWGDFFWDTPDPGAFLDSEKIWMRDIENIRATGANTIRIYNMMAYHNEDGVPKYPNPPWSHKNFLDECWNNGNNPLYVLVGIAMGDEIWHGESYNPENPWVIYWDKTLKDTVTQLKDHPAVIGFIFNNEKDRDLDITGAHRDHWWGMVKKYSEIIKSIAPTKLVGMALHNFPSFWDTDTARTYATANGASLDFWGINAYEPSEGGFDTSVHPFLPSVMGAAAKPVLLTEYGFPATEHSIPGDDSGTSEASAKSIRENDATRQKVADTLDIMLPHIYSNKQVIGMYYFEWSDEWWNQSSWTGVTSANDAGIYWEWFGGPYAGGLPNKYWDNMGFGLNSISYDSAHRNPATDNWYTSYPGGPGANWYVDTLTPRTVIINSLKTGFGNANPH